MKIMTVLISVLFVFISQVQAASPVFNCVSSIKINAKKTSVIGISIVAKGSAYESLLVGSGETEPLETTKEALSLTDSLQLPGVSDILRATKLQTSDYGNVALVEVYTAGNFDDDAAGVRTAQFLDQKGVSLAKGMFFGWAGAVKCK